MKYPLDLLQAVSDFVQRDPRFTRAMGRPTRLATIDPAYSGGAPRVTFDGETTLSGKGYARAASYTPTAGDRVLMIPAGSSYVILCEVV